MPMSTVTRSSTAPASSATQEPNEKPAAHSGRSGIARRHVVERRREVLLLAVAAGEASFAAPTPRKLKRSTAQPARTSPFAPWYTAFVCIVPPCVGSGWAKTTAAFGVPVGRVEQRLEPAGGAVQIMNCWH